ncbi:MAG: glycosyltransferase [bacterium]|nr:glycosyltransferase [bacterium]
MKVLIATNMYPTQKNPKSGTYIEQQISSLIANGIDVKIALYNRVDNGWKEYYKGLFTFKNVVKKEKPDLVHIMYGGILAASLTWRTLYVPTLISFGGSDLIPSPVENLWVRTRLRVGRWGSYWALRKAQGAIVKAKCMLEYIPPWFPKEKVWVLPNGVNLQRFFPMDKLECRKKLGWNEHEFCIMFSLNEINRRSKGNEIAEAAVQELKRRGIPAVLKKPNRIPHSEMAVWMNAADVFLLTSEHEGSPNVIKEALACNTPVVSTDVGDVAERIEGIKGCYLTERNAIDVANALEKVYRTPIQIQSRQKVENEVSLEKIAKKLIEIYHNFIQNSEK